MTEIIKQNHQQIWFDNTLLKTEAEKCFDIEYWKDQNKITGSAQGRGTTWFVQLDGLQAALRHYKRGGLFGKLVKDYYLLAGWDKTRSAQEFRLLSELSDNGVHVPRPVAARAVKKGPFFYQADLLSERIPDARDLVSILQEQSISASLYKKIGKEIRKMHDVQVNHTDLNIHNILIDINEKVWLIDFDKCYFQEQNTWKESNISRLRRSFVKEKNRRNILWQESDFEQLLLGYQS